MVFELLEAVTVPHCVVVYKMKDRLGESSLNVRGKCRNLRIHIKVDQ